MDLLAAQQFFEQILRVPSITGTPSEQQVVALIGGTLKLMGLPPRFVAKDPQRPNVAACLKAANPTAPPLVLLSHVDVVDAKPEEWYAEPFGAETVDGRIYARGALDTKQLTAMELYALAALCEKKEQLVRDVWFVATIDEEQGSRFGAGAMYELMPELFQPGALVISEGGGFPVCVGQQPMITVTAGEKGLARVQFTAKGRGGHPGAPPPPNEQAIAALSAALRRILEEIDHFNPVEATMANRMQARMGITSAEAIDDAAARDIYHYAGANSAGLREYKIGQRANVIPATTDITLEFKLLPGVTRQQLEDFIHKCVAESPVEYTIVDFEPGFENDAKKLDTMLERVQDWCFLAGFDCSALPMLALGRTDGRFWGTKGAEVYGFSPLLHDDNFNQVLTMVHSKNESVGVESFRFGCNVMRKLCIQEATGLTEEEYHG